MRDCLSNINWDDILQTKDVENMWTAFMEVLNNAIDIYVPLTSSSGRNKKTIWSDHNCLRAVKLKNKRWKKFSKSSNYNDFVEYQIATNKAVKAVRTVKLKFAKKLAKQVKEDPKSFFAYVRSKSKTKDMVDLLNNNNGNVATDNDEMCETLN